ncbi:hypothetical protein CNO08_18725 [Lysobacter capsici]|nr:hypothetical protein CNO08_18725 [Lysobacter capsici]
MRGSESGIGNRESGIGNRESGIGNRESGIGNRVRLNQGADVFARYSGENGFCPTSAKPDVRGLQRTPSRPSFPRMRESSDFGCLARRP